MQLREKKKAQTRASLIRSAQELFNRHGYEATTLEQVADHAGLHVQTLYRHFRSKQDLATAGDADLLVRFRRAIRDPERRTNTFEFWRAWVASVSQAITGDGGHRFRAFLILRWSQPTISSSLIKIGHEYEDLLTESLAADFDSTPSGIEMPRLVAIMLVGAANHASRLHAIYPGFDLAGENVAAVDRIESMFRHLIG